MQKTTVAPSVAIETDPESEMEPSIIITSTKKIEMGRKTRDKPRLKQAHRTWHERLTNFLIEKCYKRGE